MTNARQGSPDAETKEKYRKSMCADEAVSGLFSNLEGVG